eukprot:7738367-Pyramimonas_sp.AAC.1
MCVNHLTCTHCGLDRAPGTVKTSRPWHGRPLCPSGNSKFFAVKLAKNLPKCTGPPLGSYDAMRFLNLAFAPRVVGSNSPPLRS